MLRLTCDGYLLFATRFVRLFSFGGLSVGLLLYLTSIHLSASQIGLLFTLTLLGDLVLTFYLTTQADRVGRRLTLQVGAVFAFAAALVYALNDEFAVLVVAGTIGIISPTGGECGPFLAIEQAALTESISDHSKITLVFGFYNLFGYFAQALGSLTAGFVISLLKGDYFQYSEAAAYRSVMIGYAICSLLKFILYWMLSSDIEPLYSRNSISTSQSWFASKFGLHRAETRSTVAKLSALFCLDSAAGGLVLQSIMVFWFARRWQMEASMLGIMMMCANVLAGVSALLSTPLVNRIGAIETCVFTHFPSNLLLLLVPLMPSKETAVAMLLCRFTISQMDVPARQYFVNTMVDADERSAANGLTNLVRSVGVSVTPSITGYLLSDLNNHHLFNMPFYLAGGLKCVYDVLLYISFRMAKPTHSQQHIKVFNNNVNSATTNYHTITQQEEANPSSSSVQINSR